MLIIKSKSLMSNFIDAENVIINLIDSHVISGEGVIYLCRELYKKEQQTNNPPFTYPTIYKDNSYIATT